MDLRVKYRSARIDRLAARREDPGLRLSRRMSSNADSTRKIKFAHSSQLTESRADSAGKMTTVPGRKLAVYPTAAGNNFMPPKSYRAPIRRELSSRPWPLR